MNHLLNQSVCVLAVALTLLSTASALLDRPGPESPLWDLPGLAREICQINQRGAELERQETAYWRRHAARQQVVYDLIAQRLTLLKAAARFRELNAEAGAYGERLIAHCPGRTEEERLCRQVMCWAEGELRGQSPGLAEQVAARLGAELQHHLERPGTLRLPD
jgi:hypothetical protein